MTTYAAKFEQKTFIFSAHTIYEARQRALSYFNVPINLIYLRKVRDKNV